MDVYPHNPQGEARPTGHRCVSPHIPTSYACTSPQKLWETRTRRACPPQLSRYYMQAIPKISVTFPQSNSVGFSYSRRCAPIVLICVHTIKMHDLCHKRPLAWIRSAACPLTCSAPVQDLSTIPPCYPHNSGTYPHVYVERHAKSHPQVALPSWSGA